MNPSDVFDAIGDYADKHKAKTLLYCENGLWVVEVKGSTLESAKGKSPLEAYTALAKKLNLNLEKA